MARKYCLRCGLNKELDAFGKDKYRPDGLTSACKQCRNNRSRETRQGYKQVNETRTEYRDTKYCPACHITKPSSEFQKDSTQKDGLCGSCKTCKNKHCNDTQLSLGLNGRRNGQLKKKYKITLETYNKKLLEQNSVCAICLKAETRIDTKTGQISALCVDHDHDTGQIRGLLCYKCNSALGMFRDDPIIVNRASNYLNQYKNMLLEWSS